MRIVQLLFRQTFSKVLGPLTAGQVALVQNQTGNKPKRWDRTGLVVEVKPHDKYTIKMDGSGQTTDRNRRFLRPTTPYRGYGAPAPNLDPVQQSDTDPKATKEPATVDKNLTGPYKATKKPATVDKNLTGPYKPPRRSTRRRQTRK